MKKIAFIIDKIESPTAGTEKQLLLLIKNLDRNKFIPILCVLQDTVWLRTKFDLCPFYVVDIESFKNISTYFKLVKLGKYFRSEKVDILQTYFRDASIAGVLAAKIGKIKNIISTRRNQGYCLSKMDLLINKILNRMVSVFITNSEDTKKWAMKTEGIPEGKLTTIYNGLEDIPNEYFIKEKRAIYRRALGFSENSPVIGIVANLRPVKGVDVFLKAAAIIKDVLPEAKFIIVGEGGEKTNLLQLTHSLGLNGKVMFLNRREDVTSLLTVFDVGVLASHSESFSNSLLEYIASGLPVVCTAVGGCREAIENGVNGFIIPPGNFQEMAEAILKIIEEGALKNVPALNKNKAEKIFSLSQMVLAYEKNYL